MNMKKFVIIVLTVVCSLAICATTSYSKNGASKNNKDKAHSSKAEKKAEKRPAGWEKGNKTGWCGSAYPPGWSKMDGEKQSDWKSKCNKNISSIDSEAEELDYPEDVRSRINESVMDAVSKGVDTAEASKKIIEAMKDKDMRAELIGNTTATVLKLLD